MATDYRFAMKCWQDSAGSENAKINIFVNDTQVATEVEITATDSASPQVVSFEATGLADPNSDGSVTCNIKIVLTNEYYVDSSTDRNVWIDAIGHLAKMDDAGAYTNSGGYYGSTIYPLTTFTDFSEFSNIDKIPTAVTGDQIPSSFWSDALASNSGNGSFHHIPVWGSDSVVGTTITWTLYD